MRWLGALAICAGCGADPPRGVSLVLDIPNGPLDPQGFTSAVVVIREPGRPDITLSANLDANNAFALGRIDPSPSASIEATLRSDSGAAVGYGRSAVAAALTGGAEVVVPVRRPIAYIAGVSSLEIQTGQMWEERPATFSDLSVGTVLDGKATVGARAVLMVTAGGSLYEITQPASTTTGELTGTAHVTPVSTADHSVGAALTGDLTGGVLDGAGADDGSVLVIGTTTQLYAFDPIAGAARVLATGGAFDHVAIVGADTGELTAIAIKRGATCTTSELWWAPLAAGGAPAHMVATGGFADVAAERGHAYYVDACSGELGELTAAATIKARTITGKPTALAVSNRQAYVGLETQPATLSLIVASLSPGEPPRMLWTETEQQVLQPGAPPTVQRELEATSVAIGHLEIGAGGDYVALSTRAQFHGLAISEVRFPEVTIDSEELRVFDAATGGTVQRYRSACDGTVILRSINDLDGWACATIAGQAEAEVGFDHHIRSMTFQFGKK